MLILQTRRLLLREMTPDDVQALHAVLSDPIAMQHYPTPLDQTRTASWIDWNLQNYAQHGFGLWAVVDKMQQRLVGDCGLTIQWVDGVGELEVGYHILRSHWGQGLATEAATACRDYAFDRLGQGRLIAWMHPSNIASRRVAEKLGMTLEKQTQDRHHRPAVVYSMGPADRAAARSAGDPR